MCWFFILRNTHTHTQTDQAARKKKTKKNLAAERRAVRQEEREKTQWYTRWLKRLEQLRSLWEDTHAHTTAEVGREDWCENYVHTIPIHNDTTIKRNIHTYTHTHTYITTDDHEKDNERWQAKKAAYKKKRECRQEKTRIDLKRQKVCICM